MGDRRELTEILLESLDSPSRGAAWTRDRVITVIPICFKGKR